MQVCHGHPVKAMQDWTRDKVWEKCLNLDYTAHLTVVYAEASIQLDVTRCDLQTTSQ